MLTEQRRLTLHYCAGVLTDGRTCRQPIAEIHLTAGSIIRDRCLKCKGINQFEAVEVNGAVVIRQQHFVTRSSA